MNAVPIKRKGENTSATVIPFRGSSTNTASDEFAIGPQWLPPIGEIQEELRDVIETYVINAYYRHVFSKPAEQDDPFDAIYISALVPDNVWEADAVELTRYANLVDLSDQIHFNDGLDD